VILCLLSQFAPSVSTGPADSNHIDLLLKIAREYRDGSTDVPPNLDRAVHFFQYVLEQSQESTEISIAAGQELYRLLIAHPQLRSKFSRWQLLTLNAEQGDSDAQHELAIALGSGLYLDGLVPMDAAKSLFLDYSASLSGHALANMAMGYRFMQGVGVIQSCDRALPHYEFAANLAAQYLESQVVQPSVDRIRPSDLTVTGSRRSYHSGRGPTRQDITVELADYYAHLAEAGDIGAASVLGMYYLYGSKNFQANHTKGVYFLDKAAKLQHAPAAGMLGYFLAKSYVKENAASNGENSYSYESQFPVSRVVELLRQGEKKGDVYGILGMGYIHEHGVGVERNVTKSLELYSKCLHVHSDAGFYAGELRLRQIQSSTPSATAPGTAQSAVATSVHNRVSNNYAISAALHAYTASSSLGNILAVHRLGHMAARGMGAARSCESAVQAFKTVAERGPWINELIHAQALYSTGSDGGLNNAYNISYASSAAKSAPIPSVALQTLWRLLPLAVSGVENAQFLAAFLLTEHADEFPLLLFEPPIVLAAGESEYLANHNISQATHISPEHWERSLDIPRSVFQYRRKQHQDQHELTSSTDAGSNQAQGTKDAVKKILVQSEQWRRWLASYLHGRSSSSSKNTHNIGGNRVSRSGSLSSTADDILQAAEAAQHAQRLAEMRALAMLGLSASQGNADALTMLGDFHYYGSASLAADPSRAAHYYQRAADLHHTQAIFNLGVMHEVGDGVAQDFHLAKRFYDLAAEVDAKARIPRDFALLVMETHKKLLKYLGENNWLWSQMDGQTLEIMRVLAMEGVRWMDFLSNEVVTHVVLWSQSQKRDDQFGQSVPTTIRFNVRYFFESMWRTMVDEVEQMSKMVSKVGQIKMLVLTQDEIVGLVTLSSLFLLLLSIKLWLRMRDGPRD
jgi:TPR repeat protein